MDFSCVPSKTTQTRLPIIKYLLTLVITPTNLNTSRNFSGDSLACTSIIGVPESNSIKAPKLFFLRPLENIFFGLKVNYAPISNSQSSYPIYILTTKQTFKRIEEREKQSLKYLLT